MTDPYKYIGTLIAQMNTGTEKLQAVNYLCPRSTIMTLTTPGTTYPERRAQPDPSCVEHEERMDRLEIQMASLATSLKIAGTVSVILVSVFLFIATSISTKLDSLNVFVSDSKSTHILLIEKLSNIDKRVVDIELRHNHIDMGAINTNKKK